MPIATLADIVRHHSTAHPESIALSFEGHDTSYAMLDRRANQVSNGLARIGVRAGARVALLDKNNSSFFEIWFGATKANVVLVPINWRLAAPEITYIINDAQAEVLFIGADYLQTLDRIRDELKTVRQVIVTDRDFAAWRDRQSDADPELPTASGDVCAQIYTSGTTGRPKGAQLTNDNLMALLTQLNSGKWRRWSAGDVSLVVMPLFHVAGSVYALCGFYVGARNVLLRDVVPPQILKVIDRYRVTRTLLVPAVILLLLDDPGIHTTNLSSLQLMFYGASPIPIELLRKALAVFKCDFIQFYGLTETGGGITYLGAEEHGDLTAERLLSCGRPMDGVEIRIVNALGEPLPPRQVGEIICRSAQVMKGYWNLPEETAKVVKGEWLYTGDAGYLDEAGFLYIHDRVKDMIVSGGENIYPAEVESALYGHPAIADVAVIGVPDERWGEAVRAIVVLKTGQLSDSAGIMAYARERIAGYKLPKSIDFVDSLPRNPSGKILKRELRERYWQGQTRRIH